MFENDERFKAVERVRDREDLFDSYMVELERKVKILSFHGILYEGEHASSYMYACTL